MNRLAPLMGDRYGEYPYRSLIQSRAGRRPSKSQLPLRPRFSRRLLSAGATSRPSPPLENMLNCTAGRDFLAEKASRYAFLNLADTDRSLRFALPTLLGVVPIHASLQKARYPAGPSSRLKVAYAISIPPAAPSTHFKNHPADVSVKSEYCEGCMVGAIAPTTAPVGTLVWQVQTVLVRGVLARFQGMAEPRVDAR